MSDTDSEEKGSFPNPVTARLTDETYDRLEDFAEDRTEGRITVAAREAIKEGTESREGVSPEKVADWGNLLIIAGLFGLVVAVGQPDTGRTLFYLIGGLLGGGFVFSTRPGQVKGWLDI